MTAILNDQALALAPPNPEQRTGSVAAPGAESPAPVETAAPEAVEGDPTAPVPTPTETTTAQLPADVLGQSAAQETCSVGRSLSDQ